MKTLLITLSFFISTNVFSQNIINTLGTGGLFKIKDASTDYLTINQSTGQVNVLRSIDLQNTVSSTLGIIFKGGNRFMHNFGTDNTFLGRNSGNFSLSGSSNVGIGDGTLYSNTTGDNNTAVGSQSLDLNTSGDNNTALGVSTLYNNNIGNNNTGLGFQSLYSNTSGLNNTGVGYHSLINNSTGDFNTALGYSSGSTTATGNNITCIGYNADASSSTVSNQITLGNSSITSLRCNVQTITSLSDKRDKKNIKDLSLGIDFLMKIKPRLFNWDKREWYENNISDGSKMTEVPTAGFIAQELDEVQTKENAEWLNLVLKDNPEKFEATYGNLLPVMVKAIQELKVENEKLKKEVESLKSSNHKVEQLVTELNSVKQTLHKTQITKISSKGEEK